jgi:flagellar basal-body rod protein FlgC
MTSFSISASGMRASFTRLDAIAANVANALTTGPIPATPPSEPVRGEGRSVYQAVDVVQRDTSTGGTAASLRPRLPAYTPAFAPSSPDANGAGFVAAPNVDLAQEAVGLLEARLMLRANVAAFTVYDRMLKSLLDLEA